MVWYGMVWYGMVWYGMVWYGMVWYGMVWYGMVWYGMVCMCVGFIDNVISPSAALNEQHNMDEEWDTLIIIRLGKMRKREKMTL